MLVCSCFLKCVFVFKVYCQMQFSQVCVKGRCESVSVCRVSVLLIDSHAAVCLALPVQKTRRELSSDSAFCLSVVWAGLTSLRQSQGPNSAQMWAEYSNSQDDKILIPSSDTININRKNLESHCF